MSAIPTLLVAIALTGCSATPEPDAPSPGPPTSPFQRTFGPLFAAAPPGEPGGGIDGALLSGDRRSVAVSFIGGQAYEPTNPCSEDYGAWAGAAGDTLELAILRIEHPDQRPLGPNMACTAEGHGYLFTILLPAPFLGSTVRDRPTGPLWIAPPDRVVEPGLLPDGWHLSEVRGEPTIRELARTWTPGPGAPGGRDAFIAIHEAFDGPTSNAVEGPIATRSIHGADVAIGRNGDTGFAATWAFGQDRVWFTVVDPTVDLDAFAAMANAIGVRAP
jgi:hypothetical protein